MPPSHPKALKELLSIHNPPSFTSSPIINKELAITFQLVLRDFVLPWYDLISKDSEFLEELISVLIHVTKEFEKHCREFNWTEFLTSTLPLILSEHIQDYRYCCLKLSQDFTPTPEVEEIFMLLQPPSQRNNDKSLPFFLRGVTDTLLEIFLKEEYYKSDTTKLLVGEVLYKMVVHSGFDIISEPIFWNKLLAKLCEHSENLSNVKGGKVYPVPRLSYSFELTEIASYIASIVKSIFGPGSGRNLMDHIYYFTNVVFQLPTLNHWLYSQLSSVLKPFLLELFGWRINKVIQNQVENIVSEKTAEWLILELRDALWNDEESSSARVKIVELKSISEGLCDMIPETLSIIFGKEYLCQCILYHILFPLQSKKLNQQLLFNIIECFLSEFHSCNASK